MSDAQLLDGVNRNVGYSPSGEPEPTKAELYYRIFGAAWPQAIVVACRTSVAMTDVAVLGKLGTDELAASAFANVIIQMSGVILWQGFGDALIALTAQAVGARNPRLAGVWLQTSALAITLASFPIGILWYFTEDLLGVMGSSGPNKNVTKLAGDFAQWSLIWLVPDAIFGAFCQWLNGQQKVKPTILINVVFVGFNFGANVFLVHGAFGWPGLGFIGSPIATATTKIIRGVLVVYYTCYVLQLHKETWTPLSIDSIKWSRISHFLKQALPAATVGLVEQAQFVVITILVGTLGTEQLAAHSGMLNVFNVASCVMFALSDAGASTVGHYLGAGQPNSAKRVGYILLTLMMVWAVLIAAMFFAAESVIGGLFSNDKKVIGYAEELSRIVGVAYLLLSLAFASFGTLQGQGRPSIAALSMFFGLWGVSLPLAWLCGFPLHLGLQGVWLGLISGYSVMTLVMIFFVLSSPWEQLSKDAQERSETQAALIISGSEPDPVADPQP